jgi:hypothetical protein
LLVRRVRLLFLLFLFLLFLVLLFLFLLVLVLLFLVLLVLVLLFLILLVLVLLFLILLFLILLFLVLLFLVLLFLVLLLLLLLLLPAQGYLEIEQSIVLSRVQGQRTPQGLGGLGRVAGREVGRSGVVQSLGLHFLIVGELQRAFEFVGRLGIALELVERFSHREADQGIVGSLHQG